MYLSSKDLYSLCDLAIHASSLASDLIKEGSRSNIVKQKKKGGDTLASQIVTEIDFKSQEIILDILKPSIKNFNLGLLTEEFTDDETRLSKDYFWCIDPLDGTLWFTEGTPGYAVSIALVSKKVIPLLVLS